MTIFKFEIENAISIMQAGPDGTKSNEQARARSASLLITYEQMLRGLADKNPTTNAARSLYERADTIKAIVEA